MKCLSFDIGVTSRGEREKNDHENTWKLGKKEECCLFGILACIIAAKKGHTSFAWVVGIWTALAALILVIGTSKSVVAPGPIFFAIALCFKKAPVEGEADSLLKNKIAADPQKKYYCSCCGEYSTGWYETCPKCGAKGQMIISRKNSFPRNR